MTKYILFFISFFIYSHSIFAGCDSRLYFLYDDSPSVTGSGFEAEATDIIDILNDLTRDSVNVVPFSQYATANSRFLSSTNTYFSTPNASLGNHSTISGVINAAVQDCIASCNGSRNISINSQCIFIYWSDNVMHHPNPWIMLEEAAQAPKSIIDVNSAGRAFIDLSFEPASDIDPPLRGLANALKQIALDNTYGGIDYRGGDYITPMSRTELECGLKRIVSLFSSQL